MQIRIATVLATAFWWLAISPVPATAQVSPPSGLAPGSQYQVLFVTQGVRDATSPNIEDYNAFVTAQAALNPSLPSGVAWHAVGWTSSVTAPVNAPSSVLPVYDTHGVQLVPAGVGLYAGWMPNTYILDQFGQTSPVGFVWTGANGPGGYQIQNGAFLGDTRQDGNGFYVPGVTMGFSLGSGNHSEPGFPTTWVDSIQQPPNQLAPLYALSDPITVPFGLPQVSAGLRHTCAVRADGTLACWGDDANGQATPPPGVFTQVSAGATHSCAVRSNGTLACWGDNSSGKATPPPGVFTQVSAGLSHACAVRNDGSVVCWGSDSFGQATPPPGAFSQVTVGDAFTCAIQIQGGGAPVCWGDNTLGQLEPPGGFQSLRFGQLSAAGGNTCGVKVSGASGSLFCWGTVAGELGDGFAQVSAGGAHRCAVQNSELGNPNFAGGTLACWGENTSGQATPPAGTFAQVGAGGAHTCAVQRDGELACWGDNTYGQTTLTPRARDGIAVTGVNAPVSGTLVATSPRGRPMTFSIVTNGARGTVAITNVSTGAFTYTPNANVTGPDSFTFKANDGLADGNIATMAVTVTPPAVHVTANGSHAPLTVHAGSPLQIAIGFDTHGAGALNPAELYIGALTPFGVLWLGPTGFGLTPARLYGGPLPSLGPAMLINIPNVSGMPIGAYYWFMVVDADSNGALNGSYVDLVQTTIAP